MNVEPIEKRIMEEAHKRASKTLGDFSILEKIQAFELDPKTQITVKGPHIAGMTFGNNVTMTLEEFDKAIHEALVKALSEKIADHLSEKFINETASINLADL